jgi:ribonuclease HI
MRPLLRLLPLVLATASRCALVTAALALAGCGQAQSSANDFKGSEKAVASTIEDLQSAAQNRKPADICSDVLSRELADKLKSAGNDCVREMERIAGDADDFELEVTDVTVNGTTATAKVKARRGDRENAETTYSLVREDGDWRLASLGAS